MMKRNLGHPFNRTPEDRNKEYESLERRLEQKAELERREREAEREAQQERLRQKEEQEMLEQQLQSPDYINEKIISTPYFWRIKHVPYRNRVYTVDLSKSLLDNGQRKKQKHWIRYRNIAEPLNGFYTGSLPLQHAVFSHLHTKIKHPEAINAIKFIQRELDNGLATLTQLIYRTPISLEVDKTMHNIGTPNQYDMRLNLGVGDDLVPDKNGQIPWELRDQLKIILDINSAEDINEIYKEFGTTEIRIVRMDQIQQDEIRNAALMKVRNKIVFNLADSLENQLPSLGMRLLEKEKHYEEEPTMPF